MKLSDLFASTGVIILLIAFLLNLYKRLDAQSRLYCFMNFFGAALCCVSAIMIKFYPFIVLEAVWASFGLVTLFKVPRGTSSDKK